MERNPYHDYVIQELIPYRLYALSIMGAALRYRLSSDNPKEMKIYFDGKLVITGNSNAFINPAIEAGLIHCRALLEFLGLRCDKYDVLQNLEQKRKPDDIGVESFRNSYGKALTRVSPAEATACYCGDSAEGEKALLAVFHATNKGLAHFTTSFEISKPDAGLLQIAAKGVRALVFNHLYTPLGLDAPNCEIEERQRER